MKKEETDQTTLKKDWKNRERVLVLCSRGCSYRDRHLMQDFRSLMPHSKSESKMDKNQKLPLMNEICEMRNCSKCIYFESRKKKDLYVWISNAGKGPSAKFLVHNVHTMGELRLSGNCLKGSRPILVFDKTFDESPHLQLLKELFTQVFSTPNHHPKSQPFIDHVFNFSVSADGRVWFRNYQIVDEKDEQLEEIGPRMVLELIKIFEGSFGGPILFENSTFSHPNALRRQMKQNAANKYLQRVEAKKTLEIKKETDKDIVKSDPLDSLFETPNPNESDSDDEDQEQIEYTPETKRIKRDIEKKRKRKNKKLKN